MALNLNDFRTVFSDNFGNDHTLNRSLWSSTWGRADQFSFGGGALTLTGQQSQNWNPVGFLQMPSGKSAGEGYGLYQFSGYANAGQGVGIAFVMWRADNVWLDPSHPNAGTELDILESWNKTKTGTSTIHYYNSGAPSHNGQQAHAINVDLTRSHTYAMDWERGSLTFYVDGQELYQDTAHAPLDAADGGSNEVMGAEVVNEASLVTTPTVQLHITAMSYGARVSSNAPAPTPTPTPTPSPVPTPAPTPTPPSGSTELGHSAAGVLAFQVMENNASRSLVLDVQKQVGHASTLREVIDGRYVGTLRDQLADGSYAIGIATPSAGSHTISLTLDGVSGSATASFVLPAAQPANSAATGATVVAHPPVFLSGSGGIATLAAGATLTDSGSRNTLVLPAAGGVTLGGNTLGNGDVFDLRAAMTGAGWDGKSADLGSYLTQATANGGKDLVVQLHSHGGSSSTVLATLTSEGQTTGALGTFEQHALL